MDIRDDPGRSPDPDDPAARDPGSDDPHPDGRARGDRDGDGEPVPGDDPPASGDGAARDHPARDPAQVDPDTPDGAPDGADPHPPPADTADATGGGAEPAGEPGRRADLRPPDPPRGALDLPAVTGEPSGPPPGTPEARHAGPGFDDRARPPISGDASGRSDDPPRADPLAAPPSATRIAVDRMTDPAPRGAQPDRAPRDRAPQAGRDGPDAGYRDRADATATRPDQADAGTLPPDPPPEVNYRRDGISRRDAYLDAAKRADPTLRIGAAPQPFERALITGYGELLGGRVEPAVHQEVAALAGDFGTSAAYRVDSLDATGLLARLADGARRRPDYQVGDVTDAVRARIRVPRSDQLPGMLDAVRRRLGVGDRGRILEIRPGRDEARRPEVTMTVGIEVDDRPHVYDLRLTCERP